MITKDELFTKEIFMKYHPAFKNSYVLKTAIEYPTILKTDRLMEETLAAIGGYNFVDLDYQDFDDVCKSDSKTVSVKVSGQFTIKNLESKIGALRVSIYNPRKVSGPTVDFMFIPYEAVQDLKVQWGVAEKYCTKHVINGYWSNNTETYGKLQEFKVDTFEELAVAGL